MHALYYCVWIISYWFIYLFIQISNTNKVAYTEHILSVTRGATIWIITPHSHRPFLLYSLQYMQHEYNVRVHFSQITFWRRWCWCCWWMKSSQDFRELIIPPRMSSLHFLIVLLKRTDWNQNQREECQRRMDFMTSRLSTVRPRLSLKIKNLSSFSFISL